MWSERKRVEKLRYMHRNPAGLVLEPEQWVESSFRSYYYGECGGRQSVERVEDHNQEGSLSASVPTFAKTAKVGHPPLPILAPDIRFLAEQDGLPEGILKAA